VGAALLVLLKRFVVLHESSPWQAVLHSGCQAGVVDLRIARHWNIRRAMVRNKPPSSDAHTAKVIVRDATWSVRRIVRREIL
jgi:hypothetical protein